MKKYLASILLVAAISQPAFALEMNCGAPRTVVGEDYSDSNPVANIIVKHDPNEHSWRIFHQLRNGAIVSRSEQYAIIDSSSSTKTQWQGSLNRQRNLYMIGEVKKYTDGSGYAYIEWMYDRNQNNRLVMNAGARCAMVTIKETPTVQAPTPYIPKAEQGRDSVPIILTENGGAIHVDVILGGMPLRMLVDTGASGSQIPPSFASVLLQNGNAIHKGTVTVTYADGRKGEEQVIQIRELRIGSHVVRNVLATITDATPLLGFPVINGIAPFTIDTRVGELIWHTS